MTPDNNLLFDRSPVHLPEMWMSRGTGEQVKIAEASAFDFMPQIIGNRFMVDEELRKRVHFYGQELGSLMALEDANRQLSEEELETGNLNGALDAYKNCLHNAVGFVSAMAAIQDGARLSTDEISRLNLDRRFGDLELKLAAAIVHQDIENNSVSLDAEKYSAFVKKARELEKRSHQLNQLFFMEESEAYGENLKVRTKKNPKVGREYIDVSLQMEQFSTAAWIAQEMGNAKAQKKYERLAKSEPKENPRFKEIYNEIRD
jgi:hypothetical protein